MTLRDELDALKMKANGTTPIEFGSPVYRYFIALGDAYSAGDLIPADEVAAQLDFISQERDNAEKWGAAEALLRVERDRELAALADEVRELWEAADEHLNYWHELSKNGDYHRRFRVAIEALRERMER